MRPLRGLGAAVLSVAAIALSGAGAEASPANVAALQSALQALHLYAGDVDGIRGDLTRHGIVAFQRHQGLTVDGIAGPQTREALGWRGKPPLGSRVMRIGDRGWDVAAMQYLLQRAGHGPGRADGIFGPLTDEAVRRAQAGAAIATDGLAGPETIAALRRRTGSPGTPVRFLLPVAGPIGDGFGAPRNGYRHQGIDFPVPYGTTVAAAGVGTTIYAGYNSGGYGNLVVIQHRLGFTSWYAHLASITTWVGEQVVGGTRIGYVGSTGNSTGPHLHFEVRRYDTPIDAAPLLLAAVASGRISSEPPAPLECRPGARKTSKPQPGSNWIAHERLCPHARTGPPSGSIGRDRSRDDPIGVPGENGSKPRDATQGS
jgi:murein DD-endopeptidase MepM/ murein hydrolase activator NlpD